jgi:uncharacterized protein (TIGR03663 family)
MTVASESQSARKTSLESQLTTWLVLDGEKIAYVALFALAVATRFWDLGVRVMSHDESLHTRFSWDLYQGNGFQHTPLMHGPLLFHMTALSYFLFGDSDFSARIYPAALGVALVMFPALLRRWLGKLGALTTSAMFLISPLILYYSRYIRHDIPAILFAMVIAYSAWRYIEKPEFKRLGWIAAATALMFASKEVAFIYTAIFGSFLTIYLVVRLLNAEEKWSSKGWREAFRWTMFVLLLVLAVLVFLLYLNQRADELLGDLQTAPPVDPLATAIEAVEEAEPTGGPLTVLIIAIGAFGGVLVLLSATLALAGLWGKLRDFPTLDVLMVMGTLVLPMLTPFLISVAGFNPMDTSVESVRIIWGFTLPVLILSVIIGAIWGGGRRPEDSTDTEDYTEESDFSLYDWVVRDVINNRWWVIGGIYYALFAFFFTTMFTNGNGLGTGMIGSLGYWLEQQGVERGSQPPYYYMMIMVPIYEFLPLLLTLVAAPVALVRSLQRFVEAQDERAEDTDVAPPSQTRFPVLLFVGYWAVLNFVAYSLAGEKMPWLTTHLTTPMILIGGWVVGLLLEGIEWRALRERSGWLLLALIPLVAVALGRVVRPLLAGQALFVSQTQEDLAATGLWLTAFIVLIGGLVALVRASGRLGGGQTVRLTGLLVVGLLAFQTTRAAWLATFINYDNATEYLVYAHSAPSVKIVMGQIEEISLRTTDGNGLKVAYDNRVSWPFSWYLRDYPQAVFYGDQPTRSLISDAPVILAGPDNWGKVEPLIGDRYYKFEYIRMWWPMQDYFTFRELGLAESTAKIAEDLSNPQIRSGVWEIFAQRSYDTYGIATGKDFSQSNWPVAERMRFYVRKDVFAQVWDYGVAATELAEATDPYADGHVQVQPIGLISGPGSGTEELDAPRGMAIGGPDNLLYVADSGNHRVQVFTLDGAHVGTIGKEGPSTEPGAFNEPWGVAVDDDGNLYVVDTWNHRVQKFDRDGEFVTQWGEFGQGQDDFAFWGPRDIAVSQRGEVYVTDTGNKRIRVYTLDGEYVQDIGTPGGLEGQLDEPVGIQAAEDGRVYVADTWNQRVQVLNPVGGFLDQWFVSAWYGQSLDNKPFLTMDNSGHVYLTDPEGFRVLVFDTTGEFVASFGDFQTFNLASGIAVDQEGNLYVSDGLAGKILQFAPVVPPTG